MVDEPYTESEIEAGKDAYDEFMGAATSTASYEYPLHGDCEKRTQAERRAALVTDVAAALHRNVCDPNHEELGPWDTDRAEEMVAHFEQRMVEADG